MWRQTCPTQDHPRNDNGAPMYRPAGKTVPARFPEPGDEKLVFKEMSKPYYVASRA